MDITIFKDSCMKDDADIIVQKYLIDGASFFFDTIKVGQEFEFKKNIARSLDVHIRDIAIVGSGKLGFSIKPDRDTSGFYPFKKFDFDYEQDIENKKSDLDIAIVSSQLFDKQLVKIYDHTDSYRSSDYQGKPKNSFASYILKGWFRPDFIPNNYSITDDISNVQDKYRAEYGRDINIGIYKSWYFFEKYHINNVNSIKLNLFLASS